MLDAGRPPLRTRPASVISTTYHKLEAGVSVRGPLWGCLRHSIRVGCQPAQAPPPQAASRERAPGVVRVGGFTRRMTRICDSDWVSSAAE